MEDLKEVWGLLENTLSCITNKNWIKCVHHAEHLQDEDFVKCLCDDIIKHIVINLKSDSDRDSDNDRDGLDIVMIKEAFEIEEVYNYHS